MTDESNITDMTSPLPGMTIFYVLVVWVVLIFGGWSLIDHTQVEMLQNYTMKLVDDK